jgi:ribosomal protein L35
MKELKTVLVAAMNAYQVAKRRHKENVKNQHTAAKGANGEKTYFRASELGNGDRKIVYSFFAHQLPKVEKSAKNLRQLENGDYVHERYQKAWEEMGVLLSKEQRVSSRDDEWLSQFPWEWAGHYDGELDLNILRAFALGKAHVDSVFNEEANEWEIVVDIDDDYATEIGLFLQDQPGVLNPDYQPLRMVADIKTINPWGFKAIKENRDVSGVTGYIDQIMGYMWMLKTPYGSIFFESKDNNDVVEVQILWEDFYEGVTLDFTEDVHGPQGPDVVRIRVNWARMLGDDTQEGIVPRLSRLHEITEALKQADAAGDMEAIAQLMPPRCADDPKKFPCSWGHKSGEVQYCEYYDHCWNAEHNGLAVREKPAVEPIPPEAIWTFTDGDTGAEILIDSRKVPQGLTYDTFLQLVQMGALNYEQFVIDPQVAEQAVAAASSEAVQQMTPSQQMTAATLSQQMQEAAERAMKGAKDLFMHDGTLKVEGFGGVGQPPAEAQEYIDDASGDKAINCTNCGAKNTYKRLGNGNTKKCSTCGHINRVTRL